MKRGTILSGTAESRMLRRQCAIDTWNVTVARAKRMGEGDRVPSIPLSALSANEIENMRWTLARTLDKLPAAGYIGS